MPGASESSSGGQACLALKWNSSILLRGAVILQRGGGRLDLLNLGLQDALIPTINLPVAAGLFQGCAFPPF